MPEGSGKALWEKIYNQSKADGDSDEVAARKAWAGLKAAGWKKNEQGEWVKGKSEIAEMSMFINKASLDKTTQTMRWRATASDTDPDLYEESMSTELFNDFVSRIHDNTPVPEPFKSAICEDSWCGGMPYLSVAHYKAGEGARNVPGSIDPDGVYLDGSCLKAKGTLHNDKLGLAVFNSLCADLYSKKSDPDHLPVRISIGFLDLEHKHVAEHGGQDFTFTRNDVGQICPLCAQGIGGKIYMKGQLVHLAMTRVPVNPRTAMEVDKAMADDVITKKDDAKSIVGDLAEELDEKSLAQDVLVVKSDGTTNQPEKNEYDKCYDPNTDSFDQGCMDNIRKNETVEQGEVEAVKSAIRERVLAKSLAKLESTYKSHGLAWPLDAKPVVEESMELGGKNVPEEKFEFEGVHGDPMQDAKKVPAKAKAEEKETPEEDAKETKMDESKEKKAKALTAAFETFKNKALETEDIQAAFNEFGLGVEKALAPEPKPMDPNDIAAVIKSAVAEATAPLQMEIAQLRAQVKAPVSPTTPQPRSLRLQPQDLMQKSQPKQPEQFSQIRQIVRKGMGLPD